MVMPEATITQIDGQDDFSGGLHMLGNPRPNQYEYAENIDIRHGEARTRPAMLPRSLLGLKIGFWFGDGFEDDPPRTAPYGFWFPFEFVTEGFGTIQGVGVYRFAADDEENLLLLVKVAGGSLRDAPLKRDIEIIRLRPSNIFWREKNRTIL